MKRNQSNSAIRYITVTVCGLFYSERANIVFEYSIDKSYFKMVPIAKLSMTTKEIKGKNAIKQKRMDGIVFSLIALHLNIFIFFLLNPE